MKTKLKNELTPFHDYVVNTANTVVQTYQIDPEQKIEIVYSNLNYQLRIVNDSNLVWTMSALIVNWDGTSPYPWNKVIEINPQSNAYFNLASPQSPNVFLQVNSIKNKCFFRDISMEQLQLGKSLHWNGALVFQPSGRNVLEMQGNEIDMPQ